MKSAKTTYLFFIIFFVVVNFTSAQSTVTPMDFKASTIVADILAKVGSLEFNTSNSCQILETRLAKMYENIACQKAAKRFSEAQIIIDEVMQKYKIEAVAEWSITDTGASRIFISKGQKKAQTINVFATNNLVLLGY